MSRTMGIDWGRARIGVALSDTLGLLASPHGVVPGADPAQAAAAIADLARASGVTTIVFGRPINLKGQAGPETADATALLDLVRQQLPDVRIVTVDERLSSVQAQRTLRGAGLTRSKRREKSRVDETAAALILQAWLDGQRS